MIKPANTRIPNTIPQTHLHFSNLLSPGVTSGLTVIVWPYTFSFNLNAHCRTTYPSEKNEIYLVGQHCHIYLLKAKVTPEILRTAHTFTILRTLIYKLMTRWLLSH